MKAPVLLLALPLAAAGCLRTRVTVETEVFPDGSLQRRVLLASEDDGRPAEHPPLLLPPGEGYQVLAAGQGRFEGVGLVAAGAPIPSAFGLRSDALDRSAPAASALAVEDWGLFHRFRFHERVSDVVRPEEIHAAVEETALQLLDDADAALASLLGADYAATELHRDLRGSFRPLARELGLVLWRGLALEDLPEEALVRQACVVLRRSGAPLDPDSLLALAGEDEAAAGAAFLAVRAAIGGWAQQRLALVEEPAAGARRPHWPDLAGLLFDGPFERAFAQRLEERCGGPAGVERWWEAAQTRIFGLFGAGADLDFHLAVRMPGSLLRSSGYLGESGATFVEFPAKEVYPAGTGLECESVQWDATVIGALPGFARLPDNEAALRWMRVSAGGPAARPDAELIEIVRACALRRSWQPLAERAGSGDDAERAAAALAWLRGEQD